MLHFRYFSDVARPQQHLAAFEYSCVVMNHLIHRIADRLMFIYNCVTQFDVCTFIAFHYCNL